MEHTGSVAKGRVAWLDAAKLVGIYLVILGHVGGKSYGSFSPYGLVFSFLMPLFFFLSGLAQKQLPLKDSIKDSARKLLVPYVVFSILMYPYWFVVACRRHPELYPDVFYDGVVRPFLGILLVTTTKFSKIPEYSNQLWFCVGLFWCKLLYAIVQNKTKDPKKVNCALVIFLLFLGFVLRHFEIPKKIELVVNGYSLDYNERFVPFSILNLITFYVYFFAGTLLKERLFTNENKSPKTRSALLAVLFLLFTLVVYFFNSRTETADLYLALLVASCGIAFVYQLSVLVSPLPRFLSFLGRNTMTILAFHSVTNSLLVGFVKYILHFPFANESYPLSFSLLIALISLLVCAVPSYIFERWFPFVLGRRKRVASR